MNARGESPRLIRPLPANRTEASVRRHYEVEKALATKLKESDRAGRAAIYELMYDELFAEVPDHPRLVRRDDGAATAVANRAKAVLLDRYTHADSVVGEFGAGDCRFAIATARKVARVVAIDIADQAAGAVDRVDNLELVIYDGYRLPVPDDSLDVMVSDQLLEHLHPDDVGGHLELTRRVLKPGGIYIIRTPHAFTGPHDISMYFSEVAEGFHLKEWTYRELDERVKAAGFQTVKALRIWRGQVFPVSLAGLKFAESLLGGLSGRARRLSGHYALKEVCIAAVA